MPNPSPAPGSHPKPTPSKTGIPPKPRSTPKKTERKRSSVIARRRAKWAKMSWKRSLRGNLYVKLKTGWLIAIFRSWRGCWSTRIVDPNGNATLFDLDRVSAERDGCLEAFDRLLIVEARGPIDPRLLEHQLIAS
jgi:hypothetical protein